mmetsp:Transcript_22269/g.33429  ORF Transcript_22269/g.33429 Transcript_22269/m.33429 type:complete len:85 (+) Transcript_22269:201-455(+)
MRPTGPSIENNNNANGHQSQATKILAPFNPTSVAAQTRSLQILELFSFIALEMSCEQHFLQLFNASILSDLIYCHLNFFVHVEL